MYQDPIHILVEISFLVHINEYEFLINWSGYQDGQIGY